MHGGIIASGWHTGSVLMRLMSSFLGESSMGSPGAENFRWLAPVRPGDQLRLRLTVLETKASESKPDRGILRLRNEVLNQRAEVVMSMEPALFVKRRS